MSTLSENRYNSSSSFSSLDPFNSLSCLISLAQTASSVPNRSSERGVLALFLGLSRKLQKVPFYVDFVLINVLKPWLCF